MIPADHHVPRRAEMFEKYQIFGFSGWWCSPRAATDIFRLQQLRIQQPLIRFFVSDNSPDTLTAPGLVFRNCHICSAPAKESLEACSKPDTSEKKPLYTGCGQHVKLCSDTVAVQQVFADWNL